jgi:CCR4-NOT transcription complex subunit 9
LYITFYRFLVELFTFLNLLIQEIINIYPAINPPALTAHQSNRVCNALALLQCVASHADTRSAFLLAHIPLYLYPFLHTVSKGRSRFQNFVLIILTRVYVLAFFSRVRYSIFLKTVLFYVQCSRLLDAPFRVPTTDQLGCHRSFRYKSAIGRLL